MKNGGKQLNDVRLSGAAGRRIKTAAAFFVMLAVLPSFALSLLFVDGRYYALISVTFAAFSLAPFFLLIENKGLPLYKLVPVAVMTAIAVAGRAAFFFVPQFKPVVAVVIIAGVMLGAPSGFLCGSLSMLASNFLFGQGPWTPMQMLAMGLIGFISGFFSGSKATRSTVFLCAWGFIASILYGLVADTWSVLSLGAALELSSAAEIYLAGLPFSLVLAAATVIFLALSVKPLTQKIERIKQKYGSV